MMYIWQSRSSQLITTNLSTVTPDKVGSDIGTTLYSSYTIKRFNSTEMIVKREKGLYYNFDEMFVLCHLYKS